MTDPSGYTRYYHEKHPRLFDELLNLYNDLTFDGAPVNLRRKAV